MLGELFGKVLDMSLVGCYSILVVMVFRFLLSKLERKYAYYLWFVVFLNLCVPFSIQGVFSLIPDSVAEFSIVDAVDGALGANSQGEIGNDGEVATLGGMQAAAGVNFTLAGGDLRNNGYLPQTPMEKEESLPMKIAAGIWLAGIIFMLVWNLAGTVQLKKQVSKVNWVRYSRKNGIAEVAGLDAPFLWGVLKPMIYLPTDLEDEERRYVVAHERYHRKRKDYLIKIAVSFVVTIHWFNPFVWAAYALFCKDMEISCDEAVILQSRENIRKQYAGSLLKYAARQNGYSLTPITFGEPAVKTRIKNVLHVKKRGILFSVLAVICVASVAAGLVLRPSAEESMEDNSSQMADDQDVFGGNTSETDDSLTLWDDVFFTAERVEQSGTALSEEQKMLLQAMCNYIPEFGGRSEMDEDFWRYFIFGSYTCVPVNENGEYEPIYGEGEHIWVYREDLGFEEGEFKIGEEYVREYARLLFGVDMPEFYPAFEDMSEGQTALYYQDGYYYIGDSDFGEPQYQFRDLEAAPGSQENSVYVNYDIMMHNFDDGELESVGTVRFGLSAADNTNGFVITSKKMEFSEFE
ncbi:MAG: M56 family metallopeptidase [Acetatifactor sp.]|nr:M56 family metallopeptidase [Acetatifactor sp.]